MRRTFKDDVLQKSFEENGFAVVDLLNPSEVKRVEEIYFNNRVQEQPALEISVWSKDSMVNKKISDLLWEALNQKVNEILDNHRNIYSGFVSKIPGKPGVSKPHQDPSFVDERNLSSAVVWVPLCKVDETNGALYVIRGSHRILQGHRGYTFLKYDYFDIKDEVINRKFGEVVRIQPGQAIIYNNATFHYSLENQSDNIRIACTCLMIPKEATPIYYHHNKKLNTVDVYEIDSDFIFNYYGKYMGAENIDKPLLSRFTYEKPIKISLHQFEELCNGIGLSRNL